MNAPKARNLGKMVVVHSGLAETTITSAYYFAPFPTRSDIDMFHVIIMLQVC